jgi:hypothetical protein
MNATPIRRHFPRATCTQGPARAKPQWWQHLKGSQKLLGLVAFVGALLIMMNPELVALGLLGDAAFFDMLVLVLTLQMHQLVVRVWQRWVALVSRGARCMGILLRARSFSVFRRRCGGRASTSPTRDDISIGERGRTATKLGPVVDASATMPDGTQLKEVQDLKRCVQSHPKRFGRALTEKIFIYGSGRLPVTPSASNSTAFPIHS